MGASSIKKGNVVVSPITTEGLTQGKEYVIDKVFSDSDFKIKNNDGKALFCKTYRCGHIEGEDWIIK